MQYSHQFIELNIMPDSTANRDELKQSLKRLGATQKDIALAISAGESTVSFWFSGEISSPALDRAIPAYIAGLERGRLAEKTA